MTCPACSHPDRSDIDVRLAQGVALSTLRTLFGLSEPILRRHQDEHLRNLPVRVRTDPTSILVDLERVEADEWTVVELAKGIPSPTIEGEYILKPQPKLMLQALAGVRETKVTMVRMAKELAMLKKDAISRETFSRMTDTVLKALEPYPDALAAVQSALAELPE